MGCLLQMRATIELISTTKMASLEIIFSSNVMVFYLHKALGSDHMIHMAYEQHKIQDVYPITAIQIMAK